jgi:hypothetical protein
MMFLGRKFRILMNFFWLFSVRCSYICELKCIKLFVLILAIQYYFVGCQFIFESELLLVR